MRLPGLPQPTPGSSPLYKKARRTSLQTRWAAAPKYISTTLRHGNPCMVFLPEVLTGLIHSAASEVTLGRTVQSASQEFRLLQGQLTQKFAGQSIGPGKPLSGELRGIVLEVTLVDKPRTGRRTLDHGNRSTNLTRNT